MLVILRGTDGAAIAVSILAMIFALACQSAQAQTPVGALHSAEFIAGLGETAQASNALASNAQTSNAPAIQLIGWRTQTQTTAQIERYNARMKKTQPNRPGAKARRSAPRNAKSTATTKGKKGNYHYQPSASPNAKDWPNAEVQIARARCRYVLSRIKAEVEEVAPIKDGACGDPAPVRLISVGSRPRVTLDPPALLNCDMVESLHDWLQKDLQPAARRLLKSPITKIETMSSYSCRNVYGRKNASLSQHGLANAMDIRGFVTAKNKRTRLAANWGPTARDIRATKLAAERKRQQRLEKARALAAVETAPSGKAGQLAATHQLADGTEDNRRLAQNDHLAASAGERTSTAGLAAAPIRPSLLDGVSALMSNGLANALPGISGKPSLSVAPNRLGGPVLSQAGDAVKATRDEANNAEPSWPVVLASTRAKISRTQTPQARFLRLAHQSGCKRFGTILGPEANHTHRNHFHIDLARRKLGSYCR